jgi:hypothetical protein
LNTPVTSNCNEVDDGGRENGDSTMCTIAPLTDRGIRSQQLWETGGQVSLLSCLLRVPPHCASPIGRAVGRNLSGITSALGVQPMLSRILFTRRRRWRTTKVSCLRANPAATNLAPNDEEINKRSASGSRAQVHGTSRTRSILLLDRLVDTNVSDNACRRST